MSQKIKKWAYGFSKTVLYYIEEATVVKRNTLSPIKCNCGYPLQMEVNIKIILAKQIVKLLQKILVMTNVYSLSSRMTTRPWINIIAIHF